MPNVCVLHIFRFANCCSKFTYNNTSSNLLCVKLRSCRVSRNFRFFFFEVRMFLAHISFFFAFVILKMGNLKSCGKLSWYLFEGNAHRRHHAHFCRAVTTLLPAFVLWVVILFFIFKRPME